MNSTEYLKFLDELVERLEADQSVVGLITLGTTADAALRDEWSDHDFWIITEPGAQTRYSTSFDWLPRADKILLTARHGASYRGVLYRDRHSVEYAVFDREEALGGTIERFRVLIDRGGMADLAQSVRLRSHRDRAAAVAGQDKFESFCMKLWAICERSKRGESLSSRRYVQLATNTLLDLLIANGSIDLADVSDTLEPQRRLERTHPELARELEWIASLDCPAAAYALIELAENKFGERTRHLAWDKLSTIKKWIAE